MFPAAYRNVHLRECENTVFVGELKRGFNKAAEIRAVRLRECPLRELRLYFFSACDSVRQFLKFFFSDQNKKSLNGEGNPCFSL